MEEKDDNYFDLLTRGEPLEETLSAQDVREISLRLFDLLSDRTESFTQGDSSSVRAELAEELLKSICFTLAIAVKWRAERLSYLRNADLSALLRDGWVRIESEMAEGRKLLLRVKESSPEVTNISYRDTLAGLESFFSRYDLLFFAHETPCDIDYQLCHAVPEGLKGIEYINEYLRRLLTENEFCSHFGTRAIAALLESCCPDYEGLLINIFEPVAVNALGIALLGGGIPALDISDGDRVRLLNVFNAVAPEAAAVMLENAVDTVCSKLGIFDADTAKYLKATAEALCPRIRAALPTGDLSGIFLSLQRRGEPRKSAWY